MNKEKLPNLTLWFILALTVIYLISTSVARADQDKVYKNDYIVYKQIASRFNSGQYREAEQILQGLRSTHNDSYVLMWNMGIALAGQGKYPAAKGYFALALKQRPFLANNPSFLRQYADIMTNTGDTLRAEKYNERIKALSAPQSGNSN